MAFQRTTATEGTTKTDESRLGTRWQKSRRPGDLEPQHLLTVAHQLNGTPADAMTFPQFRSAAQSCPTLCDPMDCSTPGLSIHHRPPELAQIHVHRTGDVIQPFHPLSSPFPPAFNLRVTIKGQKGSGPIPGNLHPFHK